MSSVQQLRDFIRERLTAAAEEIFIQVEKTIVRSEEDIKLLETCWKPQIKLTRIDQPKLHVDNKEVLTDPELQNQQRSSSLDQEEPAIRQNQEEPEPPEIRPNQEEPEPPEIRPNQEEPEPPEIRPNQEEPEFGRVVIGFQEETRLLGICWLPYVLLTRTDVPKQHVCRTEEVLNQEEPEPVEDELSDAEHFPSEEDQENQEGPLMNEDLEGLEPNQREPEPEPPHQESGPEEPQLQEVEICSGQQLPPDCDAFMKPLSDEECELEPDMDQNLPGSDQDSFNSGFKSDPHQIKEDLEQKLQGTKTQKRLPAKSAHKSQKKVRKKENVIFCTTCGKRYYYVKSLVTHMRTHVVKLHSCETCGNEFSSAEALSSHMTEHSLDKLHSCETCGERFYRESSLLTHIRDHSDETSHPCEVCGKRCLTGKALLVHMRSHGAEKSC
ncbi:PREDICTED: zinc finger and SCAN domain-containing protein 2-like [Poecilia mexicana]|uniref:zinc finger and SCAN domain-containing protein 2-like n=1 Tax=Poecilia mexicana TaxID=48701 RepID=UPI00072ECDAF|nr:PREDICTED: zinc finger and SCAN domain-containing protein 2-like [Poecilia mexicana]